MFNIKKCRTPPYHPRQNGQCKRFNKTLLYLLGTLEDKEKARWRAYIGPLVHVLNCTKNDATGMYPYLLMFEEIRDFIDVQFGLGDSERDTISHKSYVEQLKRRLAEAYKLAESAASIKRAAAIQGPV